MKLRKFWEDRRGNYSIATAILLVPMLGAIGFGVDYADMTNQRKATLNALDAAAVATARQYTYQGGTDEELIAYAKDFFEANLGPVDPANANLTVHLPDTNEGGGLMYLTAELTYKPNFMSIMDYLIDGSTKTVQMDAEVKVRLKNTSEVALVLDNSGSMGNWGDGANERRIDLLKDAAKYLVEELAESGKKIKKLEKPVQFSLVPFSASVNIGPEMQEESWMDGIGVSPVHHENFDWSTMTQANDPDKWVQKVGDAYYKRGTGWNYVDHEGEVINGEDEPATRFSLYNDMRVVTGREWVVTGTERVCRKWRRNGKCRRWRTVEVGEWVETYGRFASWQGCVEARPHPFNTTDEAANPGNPATMFVPMFAPDEPGNYWRDTDGDGDNDVNYASWGYPNNYWVDSNDSLTVKKRQQDMRKYFMSKPNNAPATGSGDGPNHGCTTEPITPLTDVTKTEGLDAIKASIDAMSPTGYTDVPQGIMWGWRTLSHAAPFTEGRPESQKGNDKVIIVLTDGANTYRDLSNDSGLANNQSYYAAHGYTGMGYDGTGITRLFRGTSGNVGKYNYTGGNYTKAHDEHMASVCTNAKADGVIIFTVALDLPDGSSAITAMEECASESRFRKDANGAPQKLFYNTKGGDLMDVFKAIAEELSNLRIAA